MKSPILAASIHNMGKGDKRSKKGKIARKSFGVSRPKRPAKAASTAKKA